MADETGGGESQTTPEPAAADAPTEEIPVVQVPAEPAVEPAAEAAVEPAAEPAVEPAVEPAEPAVEPAVEPAEPAVEPAAEAPAEPAAEPAAEAPAEPAEPAAEAPAEAPAEPPAERHRPAWKLPVAVIGVALIVSAAAVGGVAYGRASAPEPEIIVTAEPVTEESAAAEPMPVGVLPTPPPTGPSSSEEPAPSDDPAFLTVPTAAPVLPPAVLSATAGLPDTETLANGYRLVNAGISGAQVAGVLAPVFGASGQPVADDDAWVVGTPGGPTLTVNDDPLFTWAFEDAGALAAPVVGDQLEPATAIELTTALLGTIGVDTASVDWQVDRYADRTAVTAWQLVGGQRTELGWRVAFDPSGAVVQASGFSAGLEEVPGYPVVGAASAIARSGSLPWSLVGATPARAPEATLSSSAVPLTPLALPGITVPVSEVTITEAVLGLAQYWQPDGGMLMLPSYALTGDDGSRWSLLAVDEPYVQFVDQPYPTGDPTLG